MSILVADFNWSDQVDGDTLEQTDVEFYSDANYSTAVDMSDVSAVNMKIRRGSERGKQVESLSIGSGIKWVNQSEGVIRIGDISDDQVQIDWGNGTYYYDVQFTYSSGVVRTYLKGKIPVIKDVTYG